ncbi:MAG: hypothetical protein COB07_12200 [Sulfurovum sp.]|nr:MAG: hypothetical protein COB07_12200 [Sulfurovum sp.]
MKGLYTGDQSYSERGWAGYVASWRSSFSQSNTGISTDNKNAYFFVKKIISPEGGAIGKHWKSESFRARINLIDGRIDTFPVPVGYKRWTMTNLLISDTILNRLRTFGVFAAPGDKPLMKLDSRIIGYGDGRYVLFLRRPMFDRETFYAFLCDLKNDSFAIIGKGFSDGRITSDEQKVVLWSDGSRTDTHIFEIAKGYLKSAPDLVLEPYRSASDVATAKALKSMQTFTHKKIYNH